MAGSGGIQTVTAVSRVWAVDRCSINGADGPGPDEIGPGNPVAIRVPWRMRWRRPALSDGSGGVSTTARTTTPAPMTSGVGLVSSQVRLMLVVGCLSQLALRLVRRCRFGARLPTMPMTL